MRDDADEGRERGRDERACGDRCDRLETERSFPPAEQHGERAGLQPGGHRDREGHPRQPERADECRRERRVDHDRADRGEDGRDGVLPGIERAGEDRDDGMGGRADEEREERVGSEPDRVRL